MPGMQTRPAVAVVLAAGLGTRMRSPLAKVLHPLCGRPMVGWVIEALRPLVHEIIVVVHYQDEAVRAAVGGPGVRFVRQEAPRGTGDAVAAALSALPLEGPVLITAGDTPLLATASLKRVLDGWREGVTVASFEALQPFGYGRIVREGGTRIVEEAECSPAERQIREVNAGIYVLDAALLRARLPLLQPHPPKNEFYITDLVDREATVVSGLDPAELVGVNDRAALADARTSLRRRINRAWALSGVDFEDLDHAEVGAEVVLHPDAAVGSGATVGGRSEVYGRIGANTVVTDSFVASGAVILPGSVVEGAHVGEGVKVGPMARLRPGTRLEAGCKVGNFVEIKNSTLRVGAQASHLSYLGDAEIGAGANIGAGTITCNYDGFRKHRTHIGAGAFIGSNTALVAPVRVGDGAIIGAGTVVDQDVADGAIAVARPPLKVLPDRAERLRARYRGEGRS